MIMMSRDRMAFGGPQVPSELLLGGYVVYAAVEGRFSVAMNGVASEHEGLLVVPPFCKHSVKGPPGLRSILVEAETVSPDLLQDPRLRPGSAKGRAWARRIDEAFRLWQAGALDDYKGSIDLFFFGERLPRREMEDRVAAVAERIAQGPDEPENATAVLARAVGLSPSRLRHLFCEQVGAPIRTYRAWKRLRNAIHHALLEPNLLQLAMAAGYADATHLCHSVKTFFGEPPTFVYSHWRSANFLQTGTSESGFAVEAANDGPPRVRDAGP
jgi:AraC-like DNA-binding protein